MSDEVSFDVYVLDQEGDPISGERVTAFFSYSFWPRTHSTEYADDEGHAHFSSEHPATPLSVELQFAAKLTVHIRLRTARDLQ